MDMFGSVDAEKAPGLLDLGLDKINGYRKWLNDEFKQKPFIGTIASVGLAALGIRNIISAYSSTSLSMGLIFILPSYFLFDPIKSYISTCKEAVQQMKLYKTITKGIREFPPNNPKLSVAVGIGLIIWRIRITTSLEAVKTVAAFSTAGYLLLNIDREKVQKEAKSLARDAADNMSGVRGSTSQT